MGTCISCNLNMYTVKDSENGKTIKISLFIYHPVIQRVDEKFNIKLLPHKEVDIPEKEVKAFRKDNEHSIILKHTGSDKSKEDLKEVTDDVVKVIDKVIYDNLSHIEWWCKEEDKSELPWDVHLDLEAGYYLVQNDQPLPEMLEKVHLDHLNYKVSFKKEEKDKGTLTLISERETGEIAVIKRRMELTEFRLPISRNV